MWGSVFVLYFVVHCFVSFLVLQSSEAGCFTFYAFKMSCYCNCSVAPPRGAEGWSAVCACLCFLIILTCVFVQNH